MGGRSRYERKVLTAVFIDLVGTPATTEAVDPEDLAARLLPYFDRVRSELAQHGATVEKFFGDAVVGIFGAPVSHEDDAVRAIRAALAVFESIAELNEANSWLDLKLRVGINTGEALVDLDARSVAGEGTASGDVMNTAARLQAAAPVNGILVGALTHESTRYAVEYRQAGVVDARGKSQPLQVWEVIGLRRSEPDKRSTTSFLGREAELEALIDAWSAAGRSRRPTLVAVLGSPGIGKTRLLAEFADRVGPNAHVLWGRCLPYGEGITYWPLAEVIELAAGILKSDAAATIEQRVAILLDRLAVPNADERRSLRAAMLSILGVGPDTGLSQAELHWGLRRVLGLLSRERRLLLVVEDVHWAEPTLFELLAYLVGDRDASYLIIGTCRPDAFDSVESLSATAGRSLRLDPLADGAGRAMLSELVGSAAAATATATAVLNRAAGNPLFLEEMVHMLRQQGHRWAKEDPTVEGLPIPASLEALIGSRIDQLTGEHKRIAQYAAVTGQVFWAGALSHLMGEQADDETIERDLIALERTDLIHRRSSSTIAGEREYAFKHALIRDVAYRRLPKATRTELHVRFVEWVRSLRDQELVEIVAWHLEQACLLAGEIESRSIEPPTADAIAALSRAADNAKARDGWREAERYYARALDLIGARTDSNLELRVRHAGALLGLGEIDRALGLARAARADALDEGTVGLVAEATMILCQAAYRQGWGDHARQYLTELEDLGAKLRDLRFLVRVRFMTSAVLADFDGAMPGAVEQLNSATALADELADIPLVIEGHQRLGSILFNMGRLADAEAEFTKGCSLASEAGHTRYEARARHGLGVIDFLHGRVEEGERQCLEARALLERTGETFFQIQNLVALAQCVLARGDAARAETHLREALTIALDEDSFLVAEVSRILIEALIELDRLDDASQIASFAARRAQHDQPYVLAAIEMGQAALAHAAGDLPAALEHHTAALARLEELDLRIDLGKARLAYARTLREHGDLAAAYEQLEAARATFETTGASGLLGHVRQELAEISVAADDQSTG